MAVKNVPAIIPTAEFLVTDLTNLLKPLPVSSLTPSVRVETPKRKRPRPPKMLANSEKLTSVFYHYFSVLTMESNQN